MKKQKTTMMKVGKTAYEKFKLACKAHGLAIGFVTDQIVMKKTADLQRLEKEAQKPEAAA